MDTDITGNHVFKLPPGARHTSVFETFRALAPGQTMEIADDHDPLPLYHRFQAEAPGNFSWVYAESGPVAWRVHVRKLARAHGAGECCGHCGGGF